MVLGNQSIWFSGKTNSNLELPVRYCMNEYQNNIIVDESNRRSPLKESNKILNNYDCKCSVIMGDATCFPYF